MSIEEYEQALPEKWRESYFQLKEIIITHLPTGFELVMQYGMPTFVVPLAVFPEGYLQREDEPLPFVSLAIYHMGIMGNPPLLTWFQEEYAEQVSTKLNMGKSCIRLTNPKNIPYTLVGELMGKMTVEEWIERYTHYQEKSGNRK
jgi:hypothetical protein